MYEFFFLSELMDSDFDGYKLKKILESRTDGNRKISFGVIYPLLNKLADQHYIELTENPNDNKRGRKIAHITPAGQKRFWTLMDKPVTRNQNAQQIFEAKFGSFHLLKKSQKVAVLADYQDYIQHNVSYLDDWITNMRRVHQLQPADLKDMEHVWQLRRQRLEASLNWIKAMQEEL